MAQKDPQADTATKLAASTSIFTEIGETGKQRVEAMVAARGYDPQTS